MSARYGNRYWQLDEAHRPARRVPSPCVDSRAVDSAQSHTVVHMLRKLLLVSSKFFDLLWYDDVNLNSTDKEVRRDMRQVRSLLKKTKKKRDSNY